MTQKRKIIREAPIAVNPVVIDDSYREVAEKPQPCPNNPATLRCDNEPCLFHHLGICRFHCRAWIPINDTRRSRPAPAPDALETSLEEYKSWLTEKINDEEWSRTTRERNRYETARSILNKYIAAIKRGE